MKQFKVYRHPSGALDCVKPGWSWRAFCLGGFWGFRKKMWGLGAVELSSLLVLLLPVHVAFAGVAVFVCHLVVGWQGQAWLARHLQGQGYRHADTVTAEDRGSALALSIRQRGWRVPAGSLNG
ncbi:hypothetical protein [Sphaerotilus sp.]|uniref:hypothetical protein n=1 Tax=Sphaerotilus sp. TaxID=2093942 RepID=UPI002ACE97DE|nr:hypothetical protein [Sphaerotilus sp.]MDZ7855247.1 hypothetical protein [Sphaerotilus sp.]